MFGIETSKIRGIKSTLLPRPNLDCWDPSGPDVDMAVGKWRGSPQKLVQLSLTHAADMPHQVA